MPSERLSHSP